MENGAKRLKSYCWGRGFVIVDAVFLRETFRDVADFVSYDFASIVPFSFANEFTL